MLVVFWLVQTSCLTYIYYMYMYVLCNILLITMLGKIRLLFVLTTLWALLFGQVTGIQHCPSGWLAWNQSCYMMTPTKMLWRDVHQLCRSFGARMAVPSSDEENQFINQVASEIQEETWIDCTDKDEEGKWICSEDEVAGASYRNWWDNQPNDWPGSGDGTGADFTTLYGSGNWVDFGDQLKYSMCEMKSVCLQCCTITADNNCY